MSSEPREESEMQRISDPEELSQNKRIKEILNRRTGVIDKRVAAKDAWAEGEINHSQALKIYQNAIEGLIMDLWTKFINADEADGEHLLREKKITEIDVHPPASVLPDSENGFAAGEDYPEPKTADIHGLEWFIDNDPVVTKSFTTHTWDPPGKQSDVGRALVGFDKLDKAVQECVEFIDQTGIDADMETEEQQTKIDRELLEEVDEWRQNNVE